MCVGYAGRGEWGRVVTSAPPWWGYKHGTGQCISCSFPCNHPAAKGWLESFNTSAKPVVCKRNHHLPCIVVRVALSSLSQAILLQPVTWPGTRPPPGGSWPQLGCLHQSTPPLQVSFWSAALLWVCLVVALAMEGCRGGGEGRWWCRQHDRPPALACIPQRHTFWAYPVWPFPNSPPLPALPPSLPASLSHTHMYV